MKTRRSVLSVIIGLSIMLQSPFLYSQEPKHNKGEEAPVHISYDALDALVDELIDPEADPNAQDENGDTFLMQVVRGDIYHNRYNRHETGIFAVLGWGVKWLVVSVGGLTIFRSREALWKRIRLWGDEDETLKEVLDNAETSATQVIGIGKNITMEGGRRLLINSDDMLRNQMDLVEALLISGADPTIPNNRGHSAIQIAIDNNAPPELLALLRNYSQQSSN